MPAGILRGYRDVPGSIPGVGTIFNDAQICPSSVVAYHAALSRLRLGFEFRLGRFCVFIFGEKRTLFRFWKSTLNVKKGLKKIELLGAFCAVDCFLDLLLELGCFGSHCLLLLVKRGDAESQGFNLIVEFG